MKVAIIGMGTAGVSTLNQLSKHKHFKDITVDIFDSAEDMGMGKPFQNDSDRLLINLPAKEMSLDPDDEKDFKKWYKNNATFDYGKAKYLPRLVFGHYMKSILQNLVKRHDNIFVHNYKVESCYVEEIRDERGQYKIDVCYIEDEEAVCQKYDYVFITIGTLPYKDPYQLSGLKGYIESPYPTTHALKEVKQNDDIAIIGTGLSAVDVIRFVMENHKQLPIVVTSRHAQFPTVRGKKHNIKLKYLCNKEVEKLMKYHKGIAPLKEIEKLFKRECEYQNINLKKMLNRFKADNVYNLKYDLKHEDEVGHFQSFVEEVKHHMIPIWNAMTMNDKTEFINKYGHHFKRNANPMPQSSAKQLIEWIENGDIIVKEGLTNIRKYYGKFRLKYDNDKYEYSFHYIINATGPKKFLSELDEHEHFIKGLENKQIVAPHPFGGILVLPYSNEVISPKFGTMPNLKVIGQLTSGVNFDVNGVSLLVDQSVNAVNDLYIELKERRKKKKSKSKNKSK
ncbi:FAD/NAD(P)-binding protein [Mammaliicoccus stepanovicii]|uniref:Pyridine nucleotide-disulfide oxidoreductase family protein n=1 Tax=Mammaliicoccus stepanovicii TaxID=643214 RepID=A0A239YY56_9STAP|nr:FAD/NAD(P)-binding protein [Mammaliicoccus stepanovicii]PNZ75610.1 pyridine nucleotide-disulfide oxidoreductase [Mammaliicoccus stepanovicii]GGI40505.1 pyridine nucleotide-disulfide oxidoreductase [Mammaliicoccus stepanovicii]SNV63677.1 pyridine nucleotide-disulfide oxidoreductase family protein [Mammaliicoccus stepanovicii]